MFIRMKGACFRMTICVSLRRSRVRQLSPLKTRTWQWKFRKGEAALEARKIVERAKSVLQQQLALSEDEAYRRLRKQSMKTRRTMREIAEAVILSSEVGSN